MLRTVSELCAFTLEATDGPIGAPRDVYFDDSTWTVRFIVARTGEPQAERDVLVAPRAIKLVDASAGILATSLTRQQVKNSPRVDTHKPVSRQHELEQYEYYGFPFYWGEPSLWTNASLGLPGTSADQEKFVTGQQALHHARGDDPHLRSCRALSRYHLHANDGDIGHIEDVIVDDETWMIRYLIVNTSDWWLGHRMLVAPRWISEISWLEATVAVNLTRQAIRTAPPFDPAKLPDRLYEARLFNHYGQPAYWSDIEAS
jgi:hypothetical protein